MHKPFDVFSKIAEAMPEAVKTEVYSRGQNLIAKGSVERNIYYIDKGAVRVVYCHDGQEFNIRFGYQGSVITSLPSFFDGSPSQFNMEALRKTTVKLLDRERYLDWLTGKPNGMQMYSLQLEQLISQLMERELDLLIQSPAERLGRVLARSPQLFQEIPAYHIANYLRMTPETLSRLRKS